MKVLQFVASKGWGGLENIFVNLCDEFAKVIEVDVIVFKDSEVIKRFDKNVRIHFIEANPNRLNPLLYMELYRLLKKLQPDIVHTHSAKATQIFYNLNKVLNIPHVATKHNSRKGKVFNKLQNVIAVSEGVKESILHENVIVIYNGVNPIEVFPQNTDGIFTILAAGRLDKIKGFDILIKECSKLNFPFILEIVGEGEEKRNLEKEIVKFSLEDKVKLLGFRKDVPQLMNNADIVVMSSHTEGFSLVLVEALFYANLFVSTRVSGAIEVLDERFLFDGFDIASKLNDIYQNYSKYKNEYTILTSKIQDRFLLSYIIEEHIAMYHAALKEDDK